MSKNKNDKEIIDKAMKIFDEHKGGSEASSLTIEEAYNIRLDLQYSFDTNPLIDLNLLSEEELNYKIEFYQEELDQLSELISQASSNREKEEEFSEELSKKSEIESIIQRLEIIRDKKITK